MLAWILSLLGLGGLGALFYFMGPTALLAFARGAFRFLASIPWQVYAIAGLAAVFAFLVISRGHALDRARADETRLQLVCKAVRDVAGRPRQDCGLNELQIRAFGRSISDLEAAVADQNRRIRELGQRSAQLQAQAAVAKRQAAKSADQAKTVGEKLRAAARAAAARRAPGDHCQSNPAVSEQWK